MPSTGRTGHAPSYPAHRQQINQHTIKFIVGVIAISLGPLTWIFAFPPPLLSISASYYSGGVSQSIFIGFLFATAAFLLAYNGYGPWDMWLSRLAAAAALGVALFPCHCALHSELGLSVHTAAAIIMFLILVYFCYGFYKRAQEKLKEDKQRRHARWRAGIYVVCGVLIVLSLVILAVDPLTGHLFSHNFKYLVFWGELVSLVAFGVSWLTASRIIWFLTQPGERYSLRPSSEDPKEP